MSATAAGRLAEPDMAMWLGVIPDATFAAHLGISRERVRQIRSRAGVPAPPSGASGGAWNPRRPGWPMSDPRVVLGAIDATFSMAEAAAVLGVSRPAVSSWLVKWRAIAPGLVPDLTRVDAIREHEDRIVSMWQAGRNCGEIARAVGHDPGRVSGFLRQMRRERGKDTVPLAGAFDRYAGDLSCKRWTPAEEAVLWEMRSAGFDWAEIAEALERTRAAVKARHHRTARKETTS